MDLGLIICYSLLIGIPCILIWGVYRAIKSIFMIIFGKSQTTANQNFNRKDGVNIRENRAILMNSLESYVTKSKKWGKTDAEILEVLLRNGWNEEFIKNSGYLNVISNKSSS